MIDLAAFPFFTAPGISFTLYLHLLNADQGAHIGTASDRMSSAFGEAMNSFSERSNS